MPAQHTPTPSQTLFELLAEGRIGDAADLVDRVARGRRLVDIVATLFEPVLYRIGADVALEVLDSRTEMAAVDFVRTTLSRLASRGPWKTQSGKRAIMVLPPGEEHDLGLQMLSSLLVREGWSTYRASPGQTVAEIFAPFQDFAPELVCMSVTNVAALGAAATFIREVHEHVPDTRVMVGGLAFRLVPERVVRVGADLFAEDARAALDTLRGTFGG